MAESSRTVPVFPASVIRAAEKPLLDAGEPLMRRAASALAAVTRAEIAAAADVIASGTLARRGRILVLAGPGDNGGDALFAAAELAEAADVDVLLMSDRFHVEAFAAVLAAGARRVELPAVRDAAREYTVILDGIVGLGATDAALRGTARDAVELLLPELSDAEARVIAVDLPSGVDPDTGANDGTVLPASVTVTFGGVKAGLVSEEGGARAGRIVLVDLGLGLATDDAVGTAEIATIVAG